MNPATYLIKMKIAVASGKGGVGKSMLASALAMLFAESRKVVAVDCDVDAPNLHLWLGEREDWDSVEKISTNERPVIDPEKCNLCGRCADICQFDALEMPDENAKWKMPNVKLYFCEGCGACEVICPEKAIRMEPVENAEVRVRRVRLDSCHPERQRRISHGCGYPDPPRADGVLALQQLARDSSSRPAGTQNDIDGVISFPLVSAQLYPGETGSGKIVDEIKTRAEGFDHEVMILDSPAGTGCPVIAALKDADFAILITEPTPSGLSDLKRVLTVVDHFQVSFGVVINKWDINKDLSGRIEKEFKDQMLGEIAYDKKIFQAIANLTPIMETDLPAEDEIKRIFDEFNQMAQSFGSS